MADAAPTSEPAPQLEAGTYEILRQRLKNQAEELRARLAKLNADRKQVFGAVELRLLTTERVSTEHNCVPRDMVAIGDRLLLGYNVHFGLRVERSVGDVFSVFEVAQAAGESAGAGQSSLTFRGSGLDLLKESRFEKDFQDVYRYYKNATFSRFLHRGPHLYMVFQVGKSATDLKSFKWLLKDGQLTYLDNRSDHEVRFPPQHEFEWKRTTRDAHRHGAHPHVSIEDRLFVETVGGDLTVKIENNTDSGEGIYSEPVDNRDQTLDDAEIQYAIVGNLILLKIRPYQETTWRYIVFNEKTRQALRLDAIADACVLLPDDHGLIFSSGYLLQTGQHKLFETSLQGLVFDRRIVSPNGEDTLFVFMQPESGAYVLLGYNVISQTVDTPVICHGFTLLHTGQMLLFKANGEPQKHHAIQVWQTPYTGEDFQAPRHTDSYLYKIGNRDIVRGMAECHELLGLIDKEDSYSGLYADLAKLAQDLLDSYFWIAQPEAGLLAEPLKEIRGTARSAVDEFEKVVRVRRETQQAAQRIEKKTRDLLHEVARRQFQQIDPFVKSLAALRAVRGEIIGLKELRYVDLELVARLETAVSSTTEKLSQKCVEFLLGDKALQPYVDAVAAEQAGIESLTKVTEAKAVEERVSSSARELEMLIEIVSNLKIEDATRRTAIIDNISAIFSGVNTARAGLKRKMQELAAVEGTAEFSSQLKLLSQSVVNSLDLCDTPEKCEESLTRLLVQVEELEGKFAEFDDFTVQLADKREEISGAFETRRMQIVEKRNRRAGALMQAADRILKGVKHRADAMTSLSEIHGYFAADLMIEKVREIIAELEGLGDSVKVDDLQSRLKTIREDAARQLKDRQDLFEDGQNVIRFGKHKFAVNTQPLELTTVLRDDRLLLHLTGTNFYEPVANAELGTLLKQAGGADGSAISGAAIAAMEVPSENAEVYRAEYLAYQMLLAQRRGEMTLPSGPTELLAEVQRFMSTRYREGYLKGVHDLDGAAILRALLEIDAQCGLLRHSPAARTLAAIYWTNFGESKRKKLLEFRLAGLGAIARLFPSAPQNVAVRAELQRLLEEFLADYPALQEALPDKLRNTLPQAAAESLFAELTAPDRAGRNGQFTISRAAVAIVEEFQKQLHALSAQPQFAESLKSLGKEVLAKFALALDWLHAAGAGTEAAVESAWLLAQGTWDDRAVVSADLQRELPGMIGAHPVIQLGTLSLEFNRFLAKLDRFDQLVVPRYERYHALKSQLVEQAREEMKLSEFQPHVLTSFVRNRLIDEVYLPLIGDNLAKQIGTSGEGKRTDRQGLLLLISPPGYGKTTLMEYIANRLGIIFMKVNGPAIGHAVTSLDPAAAPNAGAREEIEKLNLAFEMGDNVMIYLDDIQHCHPELLQKFISLCDAQRKIEGIWKGKSRTYDFRGKKVAVVMAGNPYTESGEKFRIPDMLANRADIYNLGEIIGDTREQFELSYLENALTSNPVLARLAARSQKDVYAVVKLAEQARRSDQPGQPLSTAGLDLEGNFSAEELGEFASVMARLLRVRDVVLTVNREYIASAAQHDDYRVQPPFLLQGSYRNMNRIAEKVLPVMNEAELESLIGSSYQNDAQTLTRGTEANLLKFKHLLGIAIPNEQTRWEEICRTFKQNVKLRGLGADDKTGQVIATLTSFGDGLESIRRALAEGMTAISRDGGEPEARQFTQLADGLRQTAEQVAASLQRMEALATRPVQVDVPPIEMRWPEKAVEEELARQPSQGPAVPDGSPATPEPHPEQRITVVNKLPRSVYQVIESQFTLMEKWLRPLTELSARQHQELSSLRPLVEECLESYRGLMEKLEGARDRVE